MLTGELAQAADKVQSAIAEVKAAQTSGDFERYGRALKTLDEAMTALEKALKKWFRKQGIELEGKRN